MPPQRKLTLSAEPTSTVPAELVSVLVVKALRRSLECKTDYRSISSRIVAPKTRLLRIMSLAATRPYLVNATTLMSVAEGIVF